MSAGAKILAFSYTTLVLSKEVCRLARKVGLSKMERMGEML